jgi:hypothetical protein
LARRVLVKRFLRHIEKLRGEPVEKFLTTEKKSCETQLMEEIIGSKDVDQKIFHEEDKDFKKINSNISENSIPEFENEFDFDFDKLQSTQLSGTEDSDVVFGSDIIRETSMEEFVMKYPESALKFLISKNIDGRPLSVDEVQVHAGWEKRGLSRNFLKKYLLELMQWPDFPDLPFKDFYMQIRNRIFKVSRS